MILFIVAPGFSAPSDTTVRPDGSITVPTVSTESSLDFISRPPIDMRSLSVTRTLTIASCHLRDDLACGRAVVGLRRLAGAATPQGCRDEHNVGFSSSESFDLVNRRTIPHRRLYLSSVHAVCISTKNVRMPRRTRKHDRRRLGGRELRHLLLHAPPHPRPSRRRSRRSDPLRPGAPAPPSRPRVTDSTSTPCLPASPDALAVDRRRRRGRGTRTSSSSYFFISRGSRGDGPSLTVTLRCFVTAQHVELDRRSDLVLPDRRREQVGVGRLRGSRADRR